MSLRLASILSSTPCCSARLTKNLDRSRAVRRPDRSMQPRRWRHSKFRVRIALQWQGDLQQRAGLARPEGSQRQKDARQRQAQQWQRRYAERAKDSD
jgi:hypothetical protein